MNLEAVQKEKLRLFYSDTSRAEIQRLKSHSGIYLPADVSRGLKRLTNFFSPLTLF
jgi:hypothetical protein